MDKPIMLTLDLGRFISVLCWYDPTTRGAKYATVRTIPEEIEDAHLRHPVAHVVFEACCQAGWIHDLCEASGLPARVASTAGEAWQWKRGSGSV